MWFWPLQPPPTHLRMCDLQAFQENDPMQLSVLGALGPGIPHIINTKLLKQFTCLTYNNGRSGGCFCKKKRRWGWRGSVGTQVQFHVQRSSAKESLPSDGLLGTSYTVPLGRVHLSLAVGHPVVLGLLLISAAGKDSYTVT